MAALSTLEAANILAVLPLKVHSHFALSEAILAALANRGHQVVVYSPFAPKPNPNIKHIDVQTKQRPDKRKYIFSINISSFKNINLNLAFLQ